MSFERDFDTMMQAECKGQHDPGVSCHWRTQRAHVGLLLALITLTTACSDLVTPVSQPDPEVRIKLSHFRDGVAPDTLVFFGRVFNDGPRDTLHYWLTVMGDSTMVLERDGFFVENQFQAALTYDPADDLFFSCLAWTARDTTEAVFATR